MYDSPEEDDSASSLPDFPNKVSETYILTPGEHTTRALGMVLQLLIDDNLPYTVGTSIEEALSGKYRRVIDCTPKCGGEKCITVVNENISSLVDIIKTLKE